MKFYLVLIIGLFSSCFSGGTKPGNTEKLDSPLIAFVFDDGWKTDYDVVAPMFEKRNVRCGFAIVKKWVGLDKRLDSLHIKELNDKGFEILAHSVGHFKMSSDLLPKDRIEKEINNSVQFLESLGCNVYGWVTPMSIMNDKYLSLLVDLDYSFTKTNGLNPIRELSNTHKLTRFGLESTSLEKAKETADRAFKEQRPIIFYAHKIDSGSLEESNLALLLDYCLEKRYNIVTPKELVYHFYDLN